MNRPALLRRLAHVQNLRRHPASTREFARFARAMLAYVKAMDDAPDELGEPVRLEDLSVEFSVRVGRP